MTRYLLRQSLAHIKLFIAANICVKQAQNRGIWRRTGPSESLSMWLESSFPRQIQTAAVVLRGKWLYYTVLAQSSLV